MTPFRFKQFNVDDTLCGMKVGMDAVLLGAWTNVNNAEKILDIGTGTAIIALMLAQRSASFIDGVEIDEAACNQAAINVSNSLWSKRINIFHTSIQDYWKSSSLEYDLIVSNPPYFINSYKAPSEKRTTARHADSLTHEDIIKAVSALLNPAGRLCLILPFNESLIFKQKAIEHYLYCNKLTFVKPRADKNANRVLMEFSFKEEPAVENELIIEESQRHHYTSDYKFLTRDYYLAF
jgi:tRNA1Val (adenine37-N6)-methyltransferase